MAERARRRAWLRWVLIGVGCLVGVWLLVGVGNTVGRYFGWITVRQDPADLSALLSPYYRVSKPEGSGPFPTALLLSGCDGPRDNLDRWAEMLVGEGWAAMIVDSHTPRGYDDFEIWRLICAGQLLMGSERAGDLLVALGDARQQPWVDRDRLVLIGASHGGWSIMELLAFEQSWRLPFNLGALPQGISIDDPLAGLLGQILVYPYCGVPNRARDDAWRHRSPTLFLLAGNDVIAPAEDCLRVAEALEARGLPVEVVVYEGVTHGFDQKERSTLSPLEFDPEATRGALARGAAFLREVSPAAR
jgi:dienelactone hydrolase